LSRTVTGPTHSHPVNTRGTRADPKKPKVAVVNQSGPELHSRQPLLNRHVQRYSHPKARLTGGLTQPPRIPGRTGPNPLHLRDAFCQYIRQTSPGASPDSVQGSFPWASKAPSMWRRKAPSLTHACAGVLAWTAGATGGAVAPHARRARDIIIEASKFLPHEQPPRGTKAPLPPPPCTTQRAMHADRGI